MGNNNARMIDVSSYIAAGINPKTGLPIRMGSEDGVELKVNIKKQLRIVDEQDAVNRYTWYNLPDGLNAQLIERILYYKGQGMLFVINDQAYFLPYALDGEIDVYGRFESVTPLPFNGTAKDTKGDAWIQGLSFVPRYEVAIPEDFEGKTSEEILMYLEKSCVLLKDYTEQMSQTIIPRQIVNDPLLEIMAECIPFLRTSLINSTGIQGMRVYNEADSANVYAANNKMYKAAIEGSPNIPIVGSAEFQSLTGSTPGRAEEFLLAMQSLDNYRLSLYGLDNGGLFQKRSHVLEAEQEMNSGNVGLINRDGLRNRQDFCAIANSIFGWDMWCEVSEVVIGIDTTGDMIAGDDESGQKEAEVNEGGES